MFEVERAVIGIYTGREDNVFWRRLPKDAKTGIETAGNPIRRLTGAIHVYGGDFFGVPRSEWDPEDLAERPYDIEKTMALFEESNRLYPPE
ncbi:MAG TPA: hypothetical protein VGT02_12515 [Methylomirabilota bacterium]|jgi:predicted metal-dependent enzyme (double-stranded beta helix superfamily)|nr:hypothetical protein [Methylomirabilota bacterium]